MIPKNVREGATAFGLEGEKAYFTIKPNGKAFRTLIDGLYSNKVRAVIRELCSNAADSHIAAGNDAPFEVTIPTTLDPTFRVRDFGTGLKHEQVMHLYTTIFESTKETTNDQTGRAPCVHRIPGNRWRPLDHTHQHRALHRSVRT